MISIKTEFAWRGTADGRACGIQDMVRIGETAMQVIQRLNRETPRLLERWHRSLKEANDWLTDLNFGIARQRVAGLILKMRTEYDASVCTLFSREEMGVMLNLKLETVSRTLSAFVREGAVQALDNQGRLYRVVDVGLLNAPKA
jgi:CRP/FNR family transcriptional regulator